MPPESRREWQNFVNSSDIEPLGRPYGYQLELPFEEPGLVQSRLYRFFEDPRNIRGLFGNISREESGKPLPEEERIRRATELKRDIRGNAKLMQDLSTLAGPGMAQNISGLEDAYSLRQLFGENPNYYGNSNPPITSQIERGVADPSTQGRVRYSDPSIPTSELSPLQRTAQTSPSLRPAAIYEDIQLLANPKVRSQLSSSIDLNDPSIRVSNALLTNLRSFDTDVYDEPISLDDAMRNADNEGMRRLVTRSPLGVVEIAGEFPGEFAENLQNLLRQSNADQDYIYDYLRESGSLPSEASKPRVEFDDESYGYSGPRKTYWDVQKFAEALPEQQQVLEGPTGSGQRISKEDLSSKYANYIPYRYTKLPQQDVGEIQAYLRSLGNKDLEDISWRFGQDISELGSPRLPLVNAISRTTSLVKDIGKQQEALKYLNNYLSNLESKTFDVPIRSAGVGGGEYINRAEIASTYPNAAAKLGFFSGDEAYVPEDFEPTLKETFYSKDGTPYVVKINRDPNYINLVSDQMNENFIAMLNDKPYAGVYNIDFSINDQYTDARVPEELKPDIMKFVKDNFRQGIPAGAVVRNAPLGNEVSRSGDSKGNKRSLWYQQFGFGANTPLGQYGYLDPDTGDTVPVQPFRSNPSQQGTETYKRSYYSLDPVSAGVQAIRQNMRGATGGAALTLLNDEVAKALDKNDYRGAATAAAKDVATGAVLEAGAKVAAPVLRRVAPAAASRVIPAVAGAARVGIPAAVGAGLFNQGRTGSALDVLTNKASTVVPGLRANPKTDLGRRAGNEARYMLNSILQNRVPYLKGRLF
jgi:hypothetical protein